MRYGRSGNGQRPSARVRGPRPGTLHGLTARCPCRYGRLSSITHGRGGAYADEEEDVNTELERLRAENAQLKRTANRGVSLKISEKGGVSVYGLGRFPVRLHQEQWTKLLDLADDIRAFIRANEASLKTKS